MPSPTGADFDDRAVRVTQTVVAIVLLGAYVFRFPVLVLVVGVALGAGAVLGPHSAPLHLIYQTLAGPRIPRGAERVAATAVRAQHALGAALLAIATLALVIHIGFIGWSLALIEAGVAAVEATTGYNAATAIRDRLRR